MFLGIGIVLAYYKSVFSLPNGIDVSYKGAFMEWICVALIIGSMVYSGGIVVEYTNLNLEIRPQINQLERKVGEWVNAAQVELYEKDRLKQETVAIRDVIGELQLTVDQAKLRMQAASLRKKRLDMALLKSSIRSRHSARMSQI
jgi:hypothetical protein